MSIGAMAGRVQLRVFATIVDRWQLSGAQVRALLGAPDDEALQRWFRGTEEPPLDTVRRLGDLIAIYTRLRTLHPRTSVADQWVHHADADPAVGGPPIAVMMAEGAEGIARVRQRLDERAAREGWM